jgi:hypothetical protein
MLYPLMVSRFHPIGNVVTASHPGTLVQAAYNAGTKNSVSTVALTRLPMMAIAIGLQNTENANGTRARIAAAAVSGTGRVASPVPGPA